MCGGFHRRDATDIVMAAVIRFRHVHIDLRCMICSFATLQGIMCTVVLLDDVCIKFCVCVCVCVRGLNSGGKESTPGGLDLVTLVGFG